MEPRYDRRGLPDMQPESRVIIIDDDPAILRALDRLFRTSGFAVETFTSPNSFLDGARRDEAGCLVLDLRMPELSGLDVQQAMSRKGLSIPIVFLSGQGDVATTAKAMRQGAVDFLVKPVDDVQLLEAVSRALAIAEERRQQRREQSELHDRLARLTKREREVCDLVVRGLLNKQIAAELGTSEKTVKVHRGRVMHKLEVDSVADLVRLLSREEKPAPASPDFRLTS